MSERSSRSAFSQPSCCSDCVFLFSLAKATAALAALLRSNCDVLSSSMPEWKSFVVDAWDAEKVSALINKDWTKFATRYLSLQGMVISFSQCVGEEKWYADEISKASRQLECGEERSVFKCLNPFLFFRALPPLGLVGLHSRLPTRIRKASGRK